MLYLACSFGLYDGLVAGRQWNSGADYGAAVARFNFEITAELAHAFAHPGQSNSKLDAITVQLF